MIWWCRQKNKPCSMANENGYCQITACCNTSTPTVKAIPIEWIEKKAQEFLMNRNFRWATDFQEVVDMWKVENNIPLFDGELKITLEKENEHK